VAEFMADALYHPKHGYYMTRDPFGRGGDFTTAPEISQMFGELIGAWCAERWQAMGRPDTVHLTELGPGRGTLMVDALRAAEIEPKFRGALSIHLVEISPVLQQVQRATLAGNSVPTDTLHWHLGLETLPEGPLLLIANEFFDALPIRQFERTVAGWCERLVTTDESSFQFSLSPPLPEREILVSCEILETAACGAIVEMRPAAIASATQIAARLARHGGSALFIDYGHHSSAAGDTLQSLRGHAINDVLCNPGSADLTAHVDFGAIERSVRGQVDVHGPVTQGLFLRRLGIELRAAALARSATDNVAIEITSACRRLVESDQMGGLFKVMALTSHNQSPPPGFEAAQ
jgi:NADH dehydrogenase [ubiquinone] 1 alpha subcomplex assembly factor 7